MKLASRSAHARGTAYTPKRTGFAAARFKYRLNLWLTLYITEGFLGKQTIKEKKTKRYFGAINQASLIGEP